jgi:hypothetical protein
VLSNVLGEVRDSLGGTLRSEADEIPGGSVWNSGSCGPISRVGFANASAASLELSGSLGSALLLGSREACLLWSFAYLVVRNLFALVWLVGRPRRSKELEILVLRHELAILRRQASRPKLTRADRALLAALSRSLPPTAWAAFSFKPETSLRWHRQLIARRWTYAHRSPGRPPLERSLRELILRLARENPHWGYKRIVGELKGLGIAVSATSVRKVLLAARMQPAPQRTHSSWRAFLRAQAASMIACDFLTVETIFLQRIYVLFFISLASRRIEYVAAARTRTDAGSLNRRATSSCSSATGTPSGSSYTIATRNPATPSTRSSGRSPSR